MGAISFGHCPLANFFLVLDAQQWCYLHSDLVFRGNGTALMFCRWVFAVILMACGATGFAVDEEEISPSPDEVAAAEAALDAAGIDVTLRILNLDPGDAARAAEEIRSLYPNDVDLFRVAEMGDGQVVQSAQADVPDLATLTAMISDAGVGGHLEGETRSDLPSASAPNAETWEPSATFRKRMIVFRFLANGLIAGGLVLVKNYAHGQTFDWKRALTNFGVHGGVNAWFQKHGSKVADVSHAPWAESKFFPNFDMRLWDLFRVTFLRSWPKRILFTCTAVTIYRLFDYWFTGQFNFDLQTAIDIAMNIGASLAPAALGLEMNGRMGPPSAKGLPARNNKVFHWQNFTLAVLFAAGLAANTTEFNKAFGIAKFWKPFYGIIASSGILWWVTNSRWTNPDLVSPWEMAKRTGRSFFRSCLGGLHGITQGLFGSRRPRDGDER